MDRADATLELRDAVKELHAAEWAAATAARVELTTQSELYERLQYEVTSATALEQAVKHQSRDAASEVVNAKGRLYAARVMVDWWRFVIEHDLEGHVDDAP